MTVLFTLWLKNAPIFETKFVNYHKNIFNSWSMINVKPINHYKIHTQVLTDTQVPSMFQVILLQSLHQPTLQLGSKSEWFEGPRQLRSRSERSPKPMGGLHWVQQDLLGLAVPAQPQYFLTVSNDFSTPVFISCEHINQNLASGTALPCLALLTYYLYLRDFLWSTSM